MIKYLKEVKAQNLLVIGIINTMLKENGYDGFKDLKVRFQKSKGVSNQYQITAFIGNIEPEVKIFELQHNPFNIFWFIFSMQQIKNGTKIRNCKKSHKEELGYSFYQSRKK